jgi:hypothetical protein
VRVWSKGVLPLALESNRNEEMPQRAKKEKGKRMLTHPCNRCPNSTDDNDIISGAN